MTGTITAAAMLAVLSGQQAPAAPDAVREVVQELRALRDTVERVLSANARLQLLMGRLQLQEVRIQTLSRQATEIDSRLAGLASERNSLVQQRLLLQREGDQTTDPREREMVRELLATSGEQLKELDARHAAMLAEQANIQQLIASEQSRWGDFNARLEEFDRLLAQPRR